MKERKESGSEKWPRARKMLTTEQRMRLDIREMRSTIQTLVFRVNDLEVEFKNLKEKLNDKVNNS